MTSGKKDASFVLVLDFPFSLGSVFIKNSRRGLASIRARVATPFRPLIGACCCGRRLRDCAQTYSIRVCPKGRHDIRRLRERRYWFAPRYSHSLFDSSFYCPNTPHLPWQKRGVRGG